MATSLGKGFSMSTKNVLTFPEMFKLTNWLNDAQPLLVELTQDQVAGTATTAMGFEVTTPNIVRAAIALNIPIGAKNVKASLVKHKAKTNEAIIAQAICNLYLKLGELIPADLKNLAE